MVSLQGEDTEDMGMHIGKAVKTQGDDGPLRAKQRGLGRNQHC